MAKLVNVGSVWYIQTDGCGCCSGLEEVTKELLQEHLEELEDEMSRTRHLIETEA